MLNWVGNVLSVAGAASMAWPLVLMSPAFAASFSCSERLSPMESLICGDPELSDLDARLSTAFKKAYVGPDKAKMLAGQRKWLAARSKRCALGGAGGAACLREYAQRLAVLKGVIARREQADSTTCSTAAELLRRGVEPELHDENLSDIGQSTKRSPFLVGRETSISKALRAKIESSGDEDVTGLTFDSGFVIDPSPRSDFIGVKSTGGGTLLCPKLNLYRKRTDGTLEPIGNPPDTKASAHVTGCSNFDFGLGPDGQPTVLVLDGDSAQSNWVFTPWGGKAWGRACSVSARYRLSFDRHFADCRKGVDCDALSKDALRWAKAWDVSEPTGAPTGFSDLTLEAASDTDKNRESIPTFGTDFDSAFEDFEFRAPLYKGDSSAGAVRVKISHPHFGSRSDEWAIIVGIYRGDGQSLGGFEFDKARAGIPNVSVSTAE